MFVAFYIFVTVASIGFIKGTYETMEQNVYSSDEIQIEVDEAKSTFVNGYVKGKLTNNSDSDIHSKYVKINFLSKKGNVILTKYLNIDELKAKETKNFTINFEAENIKSFNMSLVDEYIQEKSNAQLINLSDAENEEIKNISIFLSAIILFRFAPVEHPNKPISEKKKMKLRKKSLISFFVWTIFCIIFYFFKSEICFYSVTGIFTLNCAMIAEKIRLHMKS